MIQFNIADENIDRVSAGEALEKRLLKKKTGIILGQKITKDTKIWPKRASRRLKPRQLLLDASRIKILSYLSAHPFSQMSSIAKGLKMSLHNAEWHIGKLCSLGLLSGFETRGKIFFYLSDMVLERDRAILVALSTELGRKVYKFIQCNEGTDIANISQSLGISLKKARHILESLLSAELLSAFRDGPHKRFYLTDILTQRMTAHRRRIRRLRSSILKKLRHLGFELRLERMSDEELALILFDGKNRFALKLDLRLTGKLLEE